MFRLFSMPLIIIILKIKVIKYIIFILVNKGYKNKKIKNNLN